MYGQPPRPTFRSSAALSAPLARAAHIGTYRYIQICALEAPLGERADVRRAEGLALRVQDEDGKVSEEDLVGFCRDLQLGCHDDVSAFFKSLDTEGSGYIEHGAWTRALQEAELQSESVLETRGISSAGLSIDCCRACDANATPAPAAGPAARADESATAEQQSYEELQTGCISSQALSISGMPCL